MKTKITLAVLGAAALAVFVATPSLAGNPIQGVGVSVEASPGGIVQTTGTTDANGNYTSKTLRVGTYVVKCTTGACAGKVIKTVTITASSSATATVSPTEMTKVMPVATPAAQ